jgi:hypothetical protein
MMRTTVEEGNQVQVRNAEARVPEDVSVGVRNIPMMMMKHIIPRDPRTEKERVNRN